MKTADFITVAISALLAAITAVYAVLTSKILGANRQVVRVMREQFVAANRPYVSVDVVTDSILFQLRIRNLGKSAAENLRLQVDNDFYLMNRRDEQYNIRNISAFNVAIKSFAPGAELMFDLGASFEIYKDPSLTPLEFCVTANYDFGETHVTEPNYLDLRIFHHTVAHQSTQVQEIVKQLQELTRAVERKRS